MLEGGRDAVYEAETPLTRNYPWGYKNNAHLLTD